MRVHLALVSLGALSTLTGCGGGSTAGGLDACVRRGQCSGVSIRAAGLKLDESAYRKVFESELVQTAWAKIDRAYDFRDPQGRFHVVLMANVAGKQEVGYVTQLTEGSKQWTPLGVLLVKLFTLEARKDDPLLLNETDIYRKIADKFEQLSPVLANAGISRIDISHVDSVDLTEARASFIKLAEQNLGRPYQIRRP